MVIELSCQQVWQEISNYIESDLDPELRARMEAHFRQCKHCTAVLQGTRNVLRLVCDGSAFELPAGFSNRLYQKLEAEIKKAGK
jgi:anti-sigma factor RsiW